MLRSVQTRRRKKKRRKEEEQGSSTPPDSITDPLKETELDPLRAAELCNNLDRATQAIKAQPVEEAQADQLAADLEIESEEVEEYEEVLDELRENSSLSDEVLDLEAVAEEDLEPEEVVDLVELDDLGTLMNELADFDALDDESPVVEAIIEEEMDNAEERNTTGYANVFLKPDDLIFNEQQSQRRPMDDADTWMQVTPMSWVPNIIKVPLGRVAMDERPLDRGLNHAVKQDVSTRDEDKDIGVRTRCRFTPSIPSRREASAGLQESHNQSEVSSVLTVLQTYHEVMQSNPDMGKTFLLGQIRQLGTWASKEEPRLDLPAGQTPIEWMRAVLLPSVIADMSELERYFDMDNDMIFYRQWLSEALRVMRLTDQKIDDQARLRNQKEREEALQERLSSIPEGGLLDWSMDHPDDALELFEDPHYHRLYTERLLGELFADTGVKSFLSQLDAITAAADETEPYTVLHDALRRMDLGRLTELYHLDELDELDELKALIAGSMEALGGLDDRLKPLLLSLMGRYRTEGAALEDAARYNPTPTVMAVCHTVSAEPLSTALVRPAVEAAVTSAPLASGSSTEEDEAPEDDGPEEPEEPEEPDGPK